MVEKHINNLDLTHFNNSNFSIFSTLNRLSRICVLLETNFKRILKFYIDSITRVSPSYLNSMSLQAFQGPSSTSSFLKNSARKNFKNLSSALSQSFEKFRLELNEPKLCEIFSMTKKS